MSAIAARIGLATLAAAVLAGLAAASNPASLRIVEAGGATAPQRAYILTLPSPRALTRSQVHVTENGAAVAGLRLARQGTTRAKTAVVLAIDESLTMTGKPIQNAFAAARAFAAGANPQETIAVVTFNGKVNVLQGFTTSAAQVDKALAKTPQLAYGTKIYDALQESLQQLQSQHVSTGSIIILTDGQNVGSTVTPKATLGAISNAHVRIFSVGLDSPAYHAAALQKMAATTGGRYVEATTPAALQPLLVSLGRQLSNEYLINYTSHANPNTHVKVAVSVAGIPGTAETAYTTPPLKIVPAPPYKPSLTSKIVESGWMAAVVAIVFALLIGYGIARVFANRDEPLVKRVGDFVSVQRGGATPDGKQSRQERRRVSTFITQVSANTRRPGWLDRLAVTLELAEFEIDPLYFVFLTAIGTVLALIILGSVFGVFGYLLGACVPLVLRWWVLHRVSKRRKAFADQLPDNLDVLASALRAGHSLVSALTVVADDAPEPSKGEFQRVLAEEQFGVNLEDAFKVAIDRMENPELDQIALVARLQREVGSNSAEVLDRVIEGVRAKMELRRLVRTLTAQGRLSRWILTLLPIGLAFVLLLIAPSYMKPFFHQTLGKVLLVMAAIMVAFGSWIIGKIVDIKI